MRLAPGTDSLNNILKSEGENSYDFAFIDADKVNYDAYYEILLKVIKKGGIIAVDNTLWGMWKKKEKIERDWEKKIDRFWILIEFNA